MILTEEQMRERLKSDRNLLNRFSNDKSKGPEVDVIEMPRGGPGGDTTKKNPNAVEITSRARLGEKGVALAKEFGIAQQTVHKYKSGEIGIENEVAVQDRMNQVQDVAMCKLLSSLGFLDDSKLSKLGAKELSAVAANMAKVVGNTREQKGNDNRVTVQLFAPELRKEQSYKVLEVTSV